jgi:hypothetical protein
MAAIQHEVRTTCRRYLIFFRFLSFWSATVPFVNEPETLAPGFDGRTLADV